MNILTCNWPGNSRQTYTFGIYEMSGNWNEVPGIYIFAKEGRLGTGKWIAQYVGEAENFKNRLTDNHEKWFNAVLLGTTHIHAMINHSGTIARRAIESDLILSLNPPLNQKLSLGIDSLLSRR